MVPIAPFSGSLFPILIVVADSLKKIMVACGFRQWPASKWVAGGRDGMVVGRKAGRVGEWRLTTVGV